ncbi:hypothetical protein GDO86_004440 [Hymenochirus boettgeri]|uniref:Uncharacterized protein n=1 Tax=Hymenochirus boettgeri TaxID=247094 RepID=A0A8T2KAL4_9PIPI|nr:hypothetical protein GDO86_004440 [Hymenochirus boettgeri]
MRATGSLLPTRRGATSVCPSLCPCSLYISLVSLGGGYIRGQQWRFRGLSGRQFVNCANRTGGPLCFITTPSSGFIALWSNRPALPISNKRKPMVWGFSSQPFQKEVLKAETCRKFKAA